MGWFGGVFDVKSSLLTGKETAAPATHSLQQALLKDHKRNWSWNLMKTIKMKMMMKTTEISKKKERTQMKMIIKKAVKKNRIA